MPVYTVHAPLPVDGGRPAPERFVFVRDGFHVWAALAGLVWLAFNRLWIALFGYLVLLIAVGVGLAVLRVGSDTRATVLFVIALLMGLEAASLQRWTLSRGKWRQLDVVVGRNRDEAERRFFDRWVDGEMGSSGMPTVDRGAPPPVRPSPRMSGDNDEIMGLFPQAGSPH